MFFLKAKVKIDSPASTGSYGKYSYMNYASFPWPPLVAGNDYKRLVRGLHKGPHTL
jgi:hypothetical protein